MRSAKEPIHCIETIVCSGNVCNCSGDGEGIAHVQNLGAFDEKFFASGKKVWAEIFAPGEFYDGSVVGGLVVEPSIDYYAVWGGEHEL